MTEQNQKLSYITMTYIGKSYTRTFDSGVKGYKYMFKDNMEQQYATNFWGTDKTKGNEILEEGNKYTVGYIEKPNPRGDKPIKSAMFFGEDKGLQHNNVPNSGDNSQKNVSTAQDNNTNLMPLNEFKAQFKKEYLLEGIEQPKTDKYNEYYFIVSYLAVNVPGMVDEIKRLKQEYQDMIKQ